MEPFRQKWIYSFFMFPFLSRDQVQGTAVPTDLPLISHKVPEYYLLIKLQVQLHVSVVLPSPPVSPGCVNPEEGSEEWLVKNFGAFSAVARLKDFSTLNLIFSGVSYDQIYAHVVTS